MTKLKEVKYLINPHEKDLPDFKPKWAIGYIMGRNKTKTGYIIACEGIVNRNEKDVIYNE